MKIMKKQIIYSLLALTTVCLGACNNNDEIDTANSIFSTEPLERNAFDYWLLDNYTYPYNIDFMYRMKDIESDHKYNLVPADYDKAVALSKIIKHVWMDAYVELAGMDFLRVYVPKTFHLIGSPAYESSGNMVLGTAEGGKKITLYNVNDLNIKKINWRWKQYRAFPITHPSKSFCPHWQAACMSFIILNTSLKILPVYILLIIDSHRLIVNIKVECG